MVSSHTWRYLILFSLGTGLRTEGGGGSVTIAKTTVKLLKSFVIPRQTKKKTQDPVLCRVSCTILAVTYFGGGGITIGCTVLQRAIYLLLCEIAELLLLDLDRQWRRSLP